MSVSCFGSVSCPQSSCRVNWGCRKSFVRLRYAPFSSDSDHSWRHCCHQGPVSRSYKCRRFRSYESNINIYKCRFGKPGLLSMTIDTNTSVDSLCYYTLKPSFRSRNIFRNSKTNIYKTTLWPIVLYTSDTWTLHSNQEEIVKIHVRKISRKIHKTENPFFGNGTLA